MSINIVVKTDSFRLLTPGTGEDIQGSNPQSSSGGEYGFPLDKGLVRLNTESLLWTIMCDVFVDGHKKISFVDLEKRVCTL